MLESPPMFEILEKIRRRYGIDKLDPNKDPYKQRVRQDMEHEPQPYPPLLASGDADGTLPKCRQTRTARNH